VLIRRQISDYFYLLQVTWEGKNNQGQKRLFPRDFSGVYINVLGNRYWRGGGVISLGYLFTRDFFGYKHPGIILTVGGGLQAWFYWDTGNHGKSYLKILKAISLRAIVWRHFLKILEQPGWIREVGPLFSFFIIRRKWCARDSEKWSNKLWQILAIYSLISVGQRHRRVTLCHCGS